MCNIGKPVEIVVVDPLVLPAPLPGTPDAEPEPKPIAPSYIPVPVEVEEEPFEVPAYISDFVGKN